MRNEHFYDLIIIGGGISSSVFISSHIKNGFSGRVAIIENGRNLGGRSSTRYSLINNGWQLNHGSPNLNICNKTKNKLLETFIQELLLVCQSMMGLEVLKYGVPHYLVKSNLIKLDLKDIVSKLK